MMPSWNDPEKVFLISKTGDLNNGKTFKQFRKDKENNQFLGGP